MDVNYTFAFEQNVGDGSAHSDLCCRFHADAVLLCANKQFTAALCTDLLERLSGQRFELILNEIQYWCVISTLSEQFTKLRKECTAVLHYFTRFAEIQSFRANSHASVLKRRLHQSQSLIYAHHILYRWQILPHKRIRREMRRKSSWMRRKSNKISRNYRRLWRTVLRV